MSEDSPIMSCGGLLVLRFDYHFRIWQAFEIECLGYLKICIPMGGGPPTCLCCCYDCDANGKSSCLVS